jgi:polyhydroxyalkanoate synthesis regulator phasin
MARARRTDLLGKLADLSEEALQRIGDAPGADKLLTALNVTRERVDELQKRVRGLENLEKRITALERKVDKLTKGTSSTTTRRSTKATSTKSSGGSTARRRTTTKKT